MKDFEEVNELAQRVLMLGESNDSQDYQELVNYFNFTPPPNSLFTLRIVVSIVYGTLAVLGVIANLIFCCVIWRSEKLHTVTHMLMTNLAVSNLLFLLFHPPYFLSTYMIDTNWPFGLIMCKASFSIAYVTVTGSFYFMCLVAIDRWLAIFRRKHRLDRRRCIQLTIGAWGISVIVALPYIYNGTLIDMNDHLSRYIEAGIRCGGSPSQYDTQILILTFLLQYCVPLLIMLPAYSHLAYFLWRRPTVGIQSKEKTKKAHARRRRLIFTLIGILVILIIGWSPLFSVGVLHRIDSTISFTPYIITSMVALLGVLCTPICYLTNDGFSQQVATMFPFLRRKKNRNQTTTTRRLLNDFREFAPESEATAYTGYQSTLGLATCTTRDTTASNTPRHALISTSNQNEFEMEEIVN